MSYILDALNKSEKKGLGQDTWTKYRPSTRGAGRLRFSTAMAIDFGHDIDSKLVFLAIWYFMPTSQSGDLDRMSPSYDSSFPSITQDTVTGSQAFDRPKRNASRSGQALLKRNQ